LGETAESLVLTACHILLSNSGWSRAGRPAAQVRSIFPLLAKHAPALTCHVASMLIESWETAVIGHTRLVEANV